MIAENVAVKTVEVYENTWKFFGKRLEALKLDPDGSPVKRANGRIYVLGRIAEEAEERKILHAISEAVADRQFSEHPVSPITVNIYKRVLNTWLRWLYEHDKSLRTLLQTPLQKEENGNRRRIFTDTEVTTLQLYKPKSFSQIRAHAIALCMFDSGIRIDEALEISPEAIDFENEQIRLKGKGNKVRFVPISSHFRSMLFRYVSRTKPTTSPYVFGTKSGKMSQRNALRDLGTVERKAKVRELSWHSYRHTFATGYLRRGGKIDKLQRILGHEDIKTTYKYLHMVEDYYREGHEEFSSLQPIKR